MKRILIIGSPGSGKSVFSRRLHRITHIPLIHLDLLYWNSDKTTVGREEFLCRLRQAMAGECWIIDGNYSSTMELRLEACDTVFFLDYPVETCLSGIGERMGKPRPDMPWADAEDDPEFLAFVKEFPTNQRPQILSLLNKHPHKHICIFRSRGEADSFLSRLSGEES